MWWYSIYSKRLLLFFFNPCNYTSKNAPPMRLDTAVLVFPPIDKLKPSDQDASMSVPGPCSVVSRAFSHRSVVNQISSKII